MVPSMFQANQDKALRLQYLFRLVTPDLTLLKECQPKQINLRKSSWMKQKIDLVAFDLGNVLCTVDEISAAKKLAAKNNQKWGYVHEIVFAQDAKLRFERG